MRRMLPFTVDSPRNAGTIGPTPYLERAVRTCSLCKAQSPDGADSCRQCGADLARHSETAVALATLRAKSAGTPHPSHRRPRRMPCLPQGRAGSLQGRRPGAAGARLLFAERLQVLV